MRFLLFGGTNDADWTLNDLHQIKVSFALGSSEGGAQPEQGMCAPQWFFRGCQPGQKTFHLRFLCDCHACRDGHLDGSVVWKVVVIQFVLKIVDVTSHAELLQASPSPPLPAVPILTTEDHWQVTTFHHPSLSILL